VERPARIDFYLDFISPFGYLARGRLLAIAGTYGAEICYHPVDLAHIKRAAGNLGPSNRDIPPKCAYLTQDLQRWAARYRIPIVRQLPGPNTSRLNKGVLLAQERERAPEYVRHAWDCVWRDGLDPGSQETLDELGNRMRWEVRDFLAHVDSPAMQLRYELESTAASGRGVFGVPTFVIGEQMWWGNDRLEFLEEHLASIA
jgi:2-hydroxychromene-2-carboxylate isomerase